MAGGNEVTFWMAFDLPLDLYVVLAMKALLPSVLTRRQDDPMSLRIVQSHRCPGQKLTALHKETWAFVPLQYRWFAWGRTHAVTALWGACCRKP